MAVEVLLKEHHGKMFPKYRVTISRIISTMFLKHPSILLWCPRLLLSLTESVVCNAVLCILIRSEYMISTCRNMNYVLLMQSLVLYTLYYGADALHFHCVDCSCQYLF